MARVKSGKTTRQRKKKIFRIAKGSYASKRSRWRQVIQQVERSLRYSYVGRKDRKSEFRALWIQRINAAARMHNLSYSQLIYGLKKAGVVLDRKMLAELAVVDQSAFKELAETAKAAAGT
ncbi:MAG: 50S ribosomal protein L20 [Elusimicrobiota bacterium]|jgi:large subunit ribosomal protein L20